VLNIELGTSYLAHLMARFDGDLYRALIAYNAGPSIARSLQHGSKSWRRLSAYPRNVLAAYKSVLTPPQQVAAASPRLVARLSGGQRTCLQEATLWTRRTSKAGWTAPRAR